MNTVTTLEQVHANFTVEEALWLTAFDRFMSVSKLDQFCFGGSNMAWEAINFANTIVSGFKTFKESKHNGT